MAIYQCVKCGAIVSSITLPKSDPSDNCCAPGSWHSWREIHDKSELKI